MVLTEDEHQLFVADFLTELQEEHERRESNAEGRRRKRRTRRTKAFKRKQEEADLRNDLRRQFYEENGYKQSTDRTGRRIWLSPSEITTHHRVRRKKRKKERFKPKVPARIRDIILFVLMCAAAVMIGLMLVR